MACTGGYVGSVQVKVNLDPLELFDNNIKIQLIGLN